MIVLSNFQVSAQDLPVHVQAELIKKSNSFEKEVTELKAKIYSKNYIGEVEDFEDSSDTDSSFGDIDSENEVKKMFKVLFQYFNIQSESKGLIVTIL